MENQIAEEDHWTTEFEIKSVADLDFVIGQQAGWPIGLTRDSPPELRRRVLAGMLSYSARLKSIDYTLKHYVDARTYEDEPVTLGDEISNYLDECMEKLHGRLSELHTQNDLTFGVFGAEMTLYRIPYSLAMARMLADRGLLLEVLPILRLSLEMIAWSFVAFRLANEDAVKKLEATYCISKMKGIYPSVGKLYGHFCSFSHWNFKVHSHFICESEEGAAVMHASRHFRALSLSMCLLVLDLLVEVIRSLYGSAADVLILDVQSDLHCIAKRKTRHLMARVAGVTTSHELQQIFAFFKLLPEGSSGPSQKQKTI